MQILQASELLRPPTVQSRHQRIVAVKRMKYLPLLELEALTNVISQRDIGGKFLDGKAEAYSFKLTGAEKDLVKTFEELYGSLKLHGGSSDLPAESGPSGGGGSSSSSSAAAGGRLRSSSLGATADFDPLHDMNSRRLLFHLIATLNASYPDYDFR